MNPKVLTLVMAGGAGSRLGVLTAERAKPAMPFGGSHRLIDFPLSNCVHSGLSHLWLIEQYQSHSLNEYVSNGRPWDLDRTHGGLRFVAPYLGDEESGWHHGTADAIYRNKSRIEEFRPELVLVLSADHVYALDYRSVIQAHERRDADLTMVTTTVPKEEAGRFGVVEVAADGAVTRFEYKPQSAWSDVVTTEVFVFTWRTLRTALEELAAGKDGVDEGRSSLEDFGDELIPRLVESGRVCEWRHERYWRDVGTVEAYWRSHIELANGSDGIHLDDPAWPILTKSPTRASARIARSARIEDSLIGPGCHIEGAVESSVLGPGVRIEEGAAVRRSVILHDTVLSRDSRVDGSIIDAEVRVGEGAVVGASYAGLPDHTNDRAEDSDIAVIGLRAELRNGAIIPPGARIDPRAVISRDA